MHKSIRQQPALLGLVACGLVGCTPANAPNGDVNCHELGVPFAAPPGITDPYKLSPSESCCSEFAQSVVVVEESVDGACIPAEPIQFMCLREAGDRVCDPEENSCTSLTIRKRAEPADPGNLWSTFSTTRKEIYAYSPN